MNTLIKRIICILCILNLTFLCGFSTDIDLKTQGELKETIKAYFERYYGSLKKLELDNMDDILEENDNTYMYRTINELEIEKYKMVNLGYDNYSYAINYKNMVKEEEFIDVNFSINLEYKYKNIDKSINSSINGIEYSFRFKKLDDKWKICAITTDFDEYKDFKELVEEKVNMRGGIDKKANINKVKNYMLSRYKDIKPIKPKRESIDLRQQFTEENDVIKNKMGVAYATAYATKPVKERVFYTAESDCTNFVSQCIWASLGGYDPMNEENVKENITQGKTMIKGLWLGNAFGGTSAWENVEALWNLTTGTNIKGPKGVGLNNNKPYYKLEAKEIELGTVIQVRKKMDTRYKHSAYVTYVNECENIDYGDIFVSQHSNDKYNRSLIDLITYWGGKDCYIRCVKVYNFIK